MGKLKHIHLIMMCAVAVASSAATDAQNAPAPPPAPSAPPAPPAGPVIPPSRYVGEKVDEYVQSLAASFSISQRETDPFGMQQDPEAKPAVVRAAHSAATAASAAEPTVPFSEIIGMIQITTVMAGEKRFLVGSRSIAQGDRFPVNHNGRAIWIIVTEVSSRQVEFKNLETGEVAAHKLNALPAGMTPGTSGIAAPGMSPASPQAPLDLNSNGNAPLTPPR